MSASEGQIRVLILEDDDDIVDLIESILDRKYEFITASNGLEGLQMVEDGEPDLVICDVMMPVMNGWDFVRTLREKPGFEKTPVIFLSALSAQDQIKKGYALGAALYLTKPIDPGRLKRNIELFIDDHGIVPRPKRKRASQLHAGGVAFLQQVEKNRPAAPTPQAATPADVSAPAGPTYPAAPATESRRDACATTPVGSRQDTGATPGRADAEARQRILPAGMSPVRLDRVRVMIVEDDRDTCEMLNEALKEQYEVVEANDGMAAIEKAVKTRPDVFIIDGMLPRMTGYQLTMILKKNREFYKSPIVFISGKATPRDQEYARSLGITHFLPKPFTMPQILALVHEVVSRPTFVMQPDRPPLPQSSMPQNFSHYEQHRKTTETPTLAAMEQQSLEHRLKQQLK